MSNLQILTEKLSSELGNSSMILLAKANGNKIDTLLDFRGFTRKQVIGILETITGKEVMKL